MHIIADALQSPLLKSNTSLGLADREFWPKVNTRARICPEPLGGPWVGGRPRGAHAGTHATTTPHSTCNEFCICAAKRSRDHEGHHVILTAHVDADKREVHLVSLTMAK